MSLTDEQIEHLSKIGVGGFLELIELDLLCAQAREANALRADALRYRWLRDQRLARSWSFTSAMGWKPESLSCDQIDAAIDAVLKASDGY